MQLSRIALLILLVCPFTSIVAQKSKTAIQTPRMPIDSVSKLITYTEVVQVQGVKPNEFYKRAFDWANSYYKNPGDVIRERNPAEGKIVIKARYKIYNEPNKQGTVTDAGDVLYTLTLQFKDGRYRYELTRFNWQQLSAYAAERWMDTSSPSYDSSYAHYLKQTDDKAKELIASLKQKMGQADAKPANNW